MIVLGIDGGLHGALVTIKSVGTAAPTIVNCFDMPITGTGAKKRVDVIAAIRFVQMVPPDRVGIERAQAMPRQGSSSGFLYGRLVGAIEAVIAGLELDWRTVEASKWKAAHGLGQVKADSIKRARAIFPNADKFITMTKHDGRAEAALIAHYVWAQTIQGEKSW